MNEPEPGVPFSEAAAYAVSAIATFCHELGKSGVPREIVLYALDVNHGMCLKVILDQGFAAMKETPPSEGAQGG